MRQQFVTGNWKMVLRPESDRAIFQNLSDQNQVRKGRTDGDRDTVLVPTAISRF